jgi:hypothetical protein
MQVRVAAPCNPRLPMGYLTLRLLSWHAIVLRIHLDDVIELKCMIASTTLPKKQFSPTGKPRTLN